MTKAEAREKERLKAEERKVNYYIRHLVQLS